MNILLSPLLSFLLIYKYEALFLISFTAAFILPVPGSTTLFAASALAAQGRFDLTAVIAVALIANVAGDLAGYFLARRFGISLLSAVGFRHFLHSRHYQRITEYGAKFAPSLIFFTRFLTELGPLVNILAGIAAVPAQKFIFFDVLGETSYVLLYGIAGYFFGSQWENSFAFLVKAVIMVYALGFIALALQAFISYRYKTHSHH